jgi:hypothetical protein
MFDGQAACTITPSLTEGPYYIDVDTIRGDIREDRQGTPLHLAARILQRHDRPHHHQAAGRQLPRPHHHRCQGLTKTPR